MLLLLSSAVPSARRAASRIKRLISPRGLQASLRSSSNPGRERYRKATLSASASLIQRGLTVLINVVSVPLTVNYLGPERYGVWLTLSSLLVWLAMTDFGLGGYALINVISQSDGNDDRRAAQEYTSSAVWALSAIACILAIASLVSFQFISWSAVFRVSTVPSHELNLACALTLVFFIVSLPMSVQNAIYCAYQDGFLSNICGISMNLASLAALVIVSRLHGGLTQLVLALSGTRLLIGLINTYYMFFKRYRWLMPVPSAVRWHCIERLFKLGGKYLVVQLGVLGMYQSQPMIITQILGPTKVMIYVIAQKIITLPMDIAYMSTAPFIPAFGEANARGDWEWIRRAHRNLTLASIAAGIPILLALAFIAKPVIRMWAGSAAVPETGLIFWLSLYNLIGVLLMASGQLMAGLERANSLALSMALCALGTMGFGIVFCYEMGLSGVAMAVAISKVLTVCPIQVWAVRRIFASAKMPPLETASEAAA